MKTAKVEMQVLVNGRLESRPFNIVRERNFSTGDFDERMVPVLHEDEVYHQTLDGNEFQIFKFPGISFPRD